MYLAAQGQTMDTIKESTRLSLLIAEAVKEYDGVTEEELEAHYEEWTPELTTSHILVEDEEEAEEIIAQLNDGADFTEMVQEHSTDTGSVQNDGRVTLLQVLIPWLKNMKMQPWPWRKANIQKNLWSLHSVIILFI